MPPAAVRMLSVWLLAKDRMDNSMALLPVKLAAPLTASPPPDSTGMTSTELPLAPHWFGRGRAARYRRA